MSEELRIACRTASNRDNGGRSPARQQSITASTCWAGVSAEQETQKPYFNCSPTIGKGVKAKLQPLATMFHRHPYHADVLAGLAVACTRPRKMSAVREKIATAAAGAVGPHPPIARLLSSSTLM